MPQNTLEWVWWFATGVIFALILNILSSYIKEKLDKSFLNFSKQKELNNNAKQQKLENMIKRIEENPIIFDFLLNKSNELYTRYVFFTSLSCIFNVPIILTSSMNTIMYLLIIIIVILAIAAIITYKGYLEINSILNVYLYRKTLEQSI